MKSELPERLERCANNRPDLSDIYDEKGQHITTQPVKFAAELVRRYNAHDELLRSLREMYFLSIDGAANPSEVIDRASAVIDKNLATHHP